MEKRAQESLESGLHEMSITADEKQRRQLLQYLFALHKWNGAYNLTAIRDVMEMINKHLFDSLSVFSILRQENYRQLVDVGTGPGLPGIPLAILCPDWHITLLDSNSKKTGFLKHAQLITGLSNITVVTGRAEDQQQVSDAIISRAFSSLGEFARVTYGMQGPKTALWAMKGKFPEQELPLLPKPYRVSASHALRVPGVEGERHLLKITRGTEL